MSVLTASKIDISQVTDLQIGACSKVFEGSTPVYKVANSQGKVNENGEIIEYTVRFLGREKGFCCDCKAGQNGKLCWHIKASIACEREVREAIKEMELAIAVEKAMSDERTIQEAEVAREAPVKVASVKRETAPYQPKAFSILK